MYCKLMIISPSPPLYTSLSLKLEEDIYSNIYSNIELVTTICPQHDAYTYTWYADDCHVLQVQYHWSFTMENWQYLC